MANAIGAELVDQLPTKADIDAMATTLDGKITAVDVKHGGDGHYQRYRYRRRLDHRWSIPRLCR